MFNLNGRYKGERCWGFGLSDAEIAELQNGTELRIDLKKVGGLGYVILFRGDTPDALDVPDLSIDSVGYPLPSIL